MSNNPVGKMLLFVTVWLLAVTPFVNANLNDIVHYFHRAVSNVNQAEAMLIARNPDPNAVTTVTETNCESHVPTSKVSVTEPAPAPPATTLSTTYLPTGQPPVPSSDTNTVSGTMTLPTGFSTGTHGTHTHTVPVVPTLVTSAPSATSAVTGTSTASHTTTAPVSTWSSVSSVPPSSSEESTSHSHSTTKEEFTATTTGVHSSSTAAPTSNAAFTQSGLENTVLALFATFLGFLAV